MITTDVMEVLLRSIPQYFLFGALSLYIFNWINKKSIYGLMAEIVMVIIAFLMLLIMLGGYIPSPKTEGVNPVHIKMVIRILTLFWVIGGLSVISLIIRLVRKKEFIPLVVAIFILSTVLFFQSTRMSKVKFELHPVENEITDSISQVQSSSNSIE